MSLNTSDNHPSDNYNHPLPGGIQKRGSIQGMADTYTQSANRIAESISSCTDDQKPKIMTIYDQLCQWNTHMQAWTKYLQGRGQSRGGRTKNYESELTKIDNFPNWLVTHIKYLIENNTIDQWIEGYSLNAQTINEQNAAPYRIPEEDVKKGYEQLIQQQG